MHCHPIMIDCTGMSHQLHLPDRAPVSIHLPDKAPVSNHLRSQLKQQRRCKPCLRQLC